MRRPRPIRPWIVYVTATVLIAFGFVSFARRVGSTQPVAGVEWVQSASGPMALSVHPGSPAEEAGILAGDILIRVNGRAVANAIDAADLPWQLKPGRPARLDLARGAETTTVRLRPGWRPTLPGAPVYGFLALVGLAFLVSGAFIALRWPTIRGGTVYALLGASLFVLLVFSPTGDANFLDWTISWLDIVAGAFVPALLVHLALTLSRRAWRRRRLGVVLAYVPAFALTAAAVWLVALGGVARFDDPVMAVELRDRLQMMFLGGAVPVAALLFLKSYFRSASGMHRSQMRWMLWGMTAGLVPFTVLYAIPWALDASIPSWVELSVFPLMLVPAAFTAALARYRLHDLDLLLRRGLTEVTALFFTAAVYAASQFILRREGAGLFPLSNSGARYFGILATAIAYPQLRAWCRVWIDRAFYRKRYSYRATLLDWARELNLETDLYALMARVRQRVRATLDVPEARVFVRTGELAFEGQTESGEAWPVELTPSQIDHLEQQPYAAVTEGTVPSVPWVRYVFGMKVKGRLRAVLAVAERVDAESPFSSEDRALLGTLAAHASTALEAARLLTEVREGAEEVRRLQTRQARILESSGVGLLLVDADGKIRAWNRALEAIWGLPREHAMGCELGEIFPLHLVRAIERERAVTAAGDETRLFRYSLVNRGGQSLIVNISCTPGGPDESGGMVISLDDVTDRVKLEDQVLQQERLAALGLLAAGVAHEVNTPLTGISSYAQMLLEDLDGDDPRREILEKIEAQTGRASNIANSLLNLARPERAAFEALELNETVREVLRLFEPQIRGERIRIESSLDPDLPSIRGHKGKLQQVLLNLLLNARDAVGAEGTISVTTRLDGVRVVAEVSDDGVGISEEDLPRIFDPFFTTKGRGKGSGLGLSISYGIVREHDGEFEVASRPGEYTRFRVVLPAVGEAEALA